MNKDIIRAVVQQNGSKLNYYRIKVDAINGDDIEAALNTSIPFKTLFAALSNAQSGDKIKVFPGIYDISSVENINLAKNNVDWYFDDGAIVFFDNNLETDTSLFHDDQDTPVSFNVYGRGVFKMQNTAATNYGYNRGIYLVNPLSKVIFYAKELNISSTEDVAICIDSFGEMTIYADSIVTTSNYAIRNNGFTNVYCSTFNGGNDRVINCQNGVLNIYGGTIINDSGNTALNCDGGVINGYDLIIKTEGSNDYGILVMTGDHSAIINIYNSEINQTNLSSQSAIDIGDGTLNLFDTIIRSGVNTTYSIGSSTTPFPGVINIYNCVANKPAMEELGITSGLIINPNI